MINIKACAGVPYGAKEVAIGWVGGRGGTTRVIRASREHEI